MDIKLHLDEKFEYFLASLFHEENRSFLRKTVYFAGGCIRDLNANRTPNDYDLFFYKESDRDLFKFQLTLFPEYRLKETQLENLNLKKESIKFQLILLVSDQPHILVESFDFTINSGYYLPQSGLLKISDETQELKITKNVKTPVSALLRINKFEKMGYRASKNVYLDLVLRIVQVHKNHNEEQILENLNYY